MTWDTDADVLTRAERLARHEPVPSRPWWRRVLVFLCRAVPRIDGDQLYGVRKK